jgi:hypothetical protein
MCKIAVVGGGPGGLMTAHWLERTRFQGGVAECYDYSSVGPDPLRALVEDLGLRTRPISGHTVVLDGCHLRSDHDIRLHYGSGTLEAIAAFRRRAASLLPLEVWRSWDDDGRHPWARRTCEELLDEVADPTARRYLEVAVHSDLATEPRLTSGLNGLKNFVMDVPGYVRGLLLATILAASGLARVARRRDGCSPPAAP